MCPATIFPPRYTIRAGNWTVAVDWNVTRSTPWSVDEVRLSGVLALIRGVADAAAVWYNVSGVLSTLAWGAPDPSILVFRFVRLKDGEALPHPVDEGTVRRTPKLRFQCFEPFP